MLCKGPRSSSISAIKNSGFKSTHKMSLGEYTVAVDENKSEWLVILKDGSLPGIFSFSDIADCVIDETGDHNTLTSVSVRVINKSLSTPSIVIPVYKKALFVNAQNKEKWGARVYMDKARELQSFFLAIKAKA